jgi:hypothetical protein
MAKGKMPPALAKYHAAKKAAAKPAARKVTKKAGRKR